MSPVYTELQKTEATSVQSVPRFTPLDHHDSQVYQKENPSTLAFMGSLCTATALIDRHSDIYLSKCLSLTYIILFNQSNAQFIL